MDTAVLQVAHDDDPGSVNDAIICLLEWDIWVNFDGLAKRWMANVGEPGAVSQ